MFLCSLIVPRHFEMNLILKFSSVLFFMPWQTESDFTWPHYVEWDRMIFVWDQSRPSVKNEVKLGLRNGLVQVSSNWFSSNFIVTTLEIRKYVVLELGSQKFRGEGLGITVLFILDYFVMKFTSKSINILSKSVKNVLLTDRASPNVVCLASDWSARNNTIFWGVFLSGN